MNLYNVNIKASYDAGYDSEVDTSYSKLVFASSEKEAIDFVNKHMSKVNRLNSCQKEIIKDIFEIDFNRVKRKRVVGYYY